MIEIEGDVNEEDWEKKIENELQYKRERENYIFSVKGDLESKKGKVVLWKEENKKEKLRERRCAWLEREREWDKLTDLIWPNLSLKSRHNIFWVFSLSFFLSLSLPFLNLIAIVFAKNDLRLRSTEILSLFSLLFLIHSLSSFLNLLHSHLPLFQSLSIYIILFFIYLFLSFSRASTVSSSASTHATSSTRYGFLLSSSPANSMDSFALSFRRSSWSSPNTLLGRPEGMWRWKGEKREEKKRNIKEQEGRREQKRKEEKRKRKEEKKR